MGTSTRSGFWVPPELLKKVASHHTFSSVEPKNANCDFTNRAERFDYSAIEPKWSFHLSALGSNKRTKSPDGDTEAILEPL